MTGESLLGPGGMESVEGAGDETLRGPPSPPPRDFKCEAWSFLLADLKRRGGAGEALAEHMLELHPEAESIRETTSTAASFTDLLFDELAMLEAERFGIDVDRNLQTREPLAYWLRRRDIDRHAEVVTVWGSLPPLFVALAKASGDIVQRGCMELSARMIAAALLANPELDVRTRLRPLHSNTVRRVLELIAESQEAAARGAAQPVVESKLVSEWLAAWQRIASDPTRGPKRVGDLLGRTLLATLFKALDESLRMRAMELAVTVIVKKLNESDVLPIAAGSEEWAIAEALAEQVFLTQ